MKRMLVLLLAALLLTGCVFRIQRPEDAPVVVDSAPTAAPATEAPVTAAPAAEVTAAPDEALAVNFRFSTRDLDGNDVDESIFSGYDLVMINFWAYWCGPCIGELPELERIHETYPNVLLLGVMVDLDDPAASRAAIEGAGVTYPILDLTDGDLMMLASASPYIPMTFFLSPDGAVLSDEPYIGSRDYASWAAIVEQYLP